MKARPPAFDLEALARAVAPLVVAQLATALGASSAPFSTRRGFEPPEFLGRSKKWRNVAPSIPGAVKVGRWFVVPRDAYARWVQSCATPAVAAALRPLASTHVTEAWTHASALASVGLRAGGGKR
jgi:hypothetical protein